MGLNRRDFVKATTLAAASAAAASGLGASSIASTALSRGHILGSNQKLRFAIIGFNGRGKDLINSIRQSKDAEIVALCDADQKVVNGFESDNNNFFRTQNFREILDRNDVDAIASATPNHWHTLIAMLGCQAGKHVYIEKPISHNMYESRQVVAAARRFNRIVQCGFQNRSDTGLTGFYQKLRAGDYGQVRFVHGTCHRQRDSIGKLESPLQVPDHIDYDVWLGPAADQPLMRPRLHYDWHWDFNTGNGDVGNQGPHEWDLINWALGDHPDLPTSMVAAGNRFGWRDAGNTPNVMACLGVLRDIPFCFEVMDLKTKCPPPFNKGVGVIIRTEQGRFVGGRGGGKFTFDNGKEENFARAEWQKNADGLPAHMQNFIDAVAANDYRLLKSDCAIAANSSAMAHMANISYQMGQTADRSALANAFASTPESQEMLERLYSAPTQFAAETGQSGDAVQWQLGPVLTFDSQTHQFTGERAEEANKAMKRDYRAGYELPDVS